MKSDASRLRRELVVRVLYFTDRSDPLREQLESDAGPTRIRMVGVVTSSRSCGPHRSRCQERGRAEPA
jgi:hypothetical protein